MSISIGRFASCHSGTATRRPGRTDVFRFNLGSLCYTLLGSVAIARSFNINIVLAFDVVELIVLLEMLVARRNIRLLMGMRWSACALCSKYKADDDTDIFAQNLLDRVA